MTASDAPAAAAPDPLESLPDWVATTFARSSVATAVVGPDHRVRWANAALLRLAGRQAHELLSHPLVEIAHAEDRMELHAALGAPAAIGAGPTLESRGTVRVRVRGRSPQVWAEMCANPLVLPGSPDAGALVQAIDVTEEVRTEHALQVLSANAMDIVALTDDEGLVTWVSPSMRAVLGHDPGSMVGTELSALVAHEDLLGLSDALAGSEPGQGPTTRTVRFRSTSGAYRYMSVTARPAGVAGGGARTAIAMHDVTEERRAKRELARSEEQFRMAMLGAPEGMAVTDSQDRIVQVNAALCELLGASVPQLIGHRFREFIPEAEREQVDQWRDRLLRGNSSIERSQHHLASATSEVWVDHSVGIMRDELGNPQLFVHQFADRTAARRLQADLAYRASHDVQTGLANRESLRTRLGQRLGCPPESQDAVGVLFCDIDNLKPINDRYGHLVGDQVISMVANRLERAVRRQDVVARVGGDEFVIVLDHCASVDELGVVARNVQAAASHPVQTTSGTVEVTITVGAVLAESTSDTEEALARADAALYRAKRSGRNQICVEGLTEH